MQNLHKPLKQCPSIKDKTVTVKTSFSHSHALFRYKTVKAHSQKNAE